MQARVKQSWLGGYKTSPKKKGRGETKKGKVEKVIESRERKNRREEAKKNSEGREGREGLGRAG